MSEGPNPQPEAKPDPAASQPTPTPHPDPAAPAPTPKNSTPATPKPAGPKVSKTHEEESAVTRVLGAILHVIVFPVKLVFKPLIFRVTHERGHPKVFFTSFSSLIYLWPIMAVGFLGCAMESFEWVKVGSATFGWIWITTVLVVLITVAADIDRNKAIVLVLFIAVCWLSGYLLQDKKDIQVLSGIYNFFARQDVKFDAGTAMVISVFIAIIEIGVIVMAWLNGRYEITTREITHRIVGRTSDSLPRAAKRIKQECRDMAEAVIGLGAGDVIVLDTQMNVVLRIPNVPFLWFFRRDIDEVLEVLATTEAEDIAAAIEEEDM